MNPYYILEVGQIYISNYTGDIYLILEVNKKTAMQHDVKYECLYHSIYPELVGESWGIGSFLKDEYTLIS
jgi:hypothetical protein